MISDFLGLVIEKSQDLISLVSETEEKGGVIQIPVQHHDKQVLNLCSWSDEMNQTKWVHVVCVL